MRLTQNHTPIDKYFIGDEQVLVKREDLSCPHPAPMFSKLRGVVSHIQKRPPTEMIGCLDTYHSKAGWGVAYVCQRLDRPCTVFYPRYKADKGLREQQVMARKFGANLVALNAGRSAILYHRAKKVLGELSPQSYMMPNALKLAESVTETAEEVKRCPSVLFDGYTWVISISSGTIASGVLRGLSERQANVSVILHMGYTRSEDAVRKYLQKKSGGFPDDMVSLVDEGFQYRDAVDGQAPFPCNPYYDLKAWEWLKRNIRSINSPVLFWNIGA